MNFQHHTCIGRTADFLVFSLCVLFPLLAMGAADNAPDVSPPPLPPVAISTSDLLDDQRKISVGDHIIFRVIEDRDDPRPLVVMDSGEVDIPYIGRVQAAGKTCKELAALIKPLLEKDYYYQATVLLSIDANRQSKGKIYLAGQLRTTGPQDIPPDEVYTLSKAILRAGGFLDFADKRKVRVIRKKTADSKEATTIYVDMVDVIEKGKVDKDLVLQADDYIFVDQKLVNF